MNFLSTAHQEVQRQHQILSAITEALPASVVIVDSGGRYRYVNSAFERCVRRPAAEILGRTAMEVLGAAEVARRRPCMQRAFAGHAVDFMLDCPGEHGTTWLSLSCIALRLDGMFDGFVGVSQDVTMQRREQERLARLAERDPLNGLLNRAGFAKHVVAVADAAEGAVTVALLYIDFDHFKSVNDTLGHAAGDDLLREFARRLHRVVRGDDAVARLGGDEFAVPLVDCELEAARHVADKVLAAAQAPFSLDGRQRTSSASIGIAVLPRAGVSLPALSARAPTRCSTAPRRPAVAGTTATGRNAQQPRSRRSDGGRRCGNAGGHADLAREHRRDVLLHPGAMGKHIIARS